MQNARNFAKFCGIPQNFSVKMPQNSAKFREILCIVPDVPKIPYFTGSQKTTSVDTLYEGDRGEVICIMSKKTVLYKP